MRPLPIESVAVTSAAGRRVSAVSDLLHELAAAGVTVVEEPGPVTVAIGSSPADMVWRDHAAIYIHTGPAEAIRDKVGVTIPLTDQNTAGTVNALRWALRARNAPFEIADHGDVAAHAVCCADSYQDPTHPEKMFRHAIDAADELTDTFPEILAILGTGYPFYCTDSSPTPGVGWTTPVSIRTFTQVQAAHFASKLADWLPRDVPYTEEELRAAGVEPGHSEHSAYEWIRWGHTPPTGPVKGTVAEHIRANTLDIGERLWPCHLCTELHDSAKYPDQSWQRAFMVGCLDCGQTPFLPRAVGVLGSDIDLVAVVDIDDAHALAHRISSWIDDHPRWFRHDTRWGSQLGGDHGPLDVFVTDHRKLTEAFAELTNPDYDWMTVTVESTVTWLPPSQISYEIGKYFPLCMELLVDRTDGKFTDTVLNTRAAFVSRATSAEIIDRYQHDSHYLRQLAGTSTVRSVLDERASRWSAKRL